MSTPDDPRAQPGAAAKDEVISDLMARYHVLVVRLAHTMLQDLDDAEDAAQETFVRAYLNLDRFRAESDVKTWLYAIAVNVCRAELRRRRARVSLGGALRALLSVTGKPSTLEETAMQAAAGDRLWREVARLDEKHRTPLVLRYIDRLTVPQIARILGLREGTVHSRLHHAREKLLKRLGDDPADAAGSRAARNEVCQ
jgi:RNA polymerase sigma-70 factor, ECF subfamily